MKHNTELTRLDNKTILITGAGDGIGKAVSLDCAKRGATVILLDKVVHKLELVYDEIIANGGAKPAIYPLDLEGASADNYQELASIIEKEFGKLDGLLNNAGWLGASTPIEIYDTELWYRVIQINLNAAFMLTRACIPLIKKSTSGSIVFTLDNKHSAYWGAYGVAKSGLQTFMQILADELESSNITVNGMDPGAIHTSFRTRAYPGEDPGSLKKPDDVSAMFSYLLGGNCEEITGNVFTPEAFE